MNCFDSDCIALRNHTIHYISSNSASLNVFLPNNKQTLKNNRTVDIFEKNVDSSQIFASAEEVAYNDRESIFKPEERQSKVVCLFFF